MFGYGYSGALSRLVSVIGAVVLALTIVGAAVGPAAVAQATPTSSGTACETVLA